MLNITFNQIVSEWKVFPFKAHEAGTVSKDATGNLNKDLLKCFDSVSEIVDKVTLLVFIGKSIIRYHKTSNKIS